MPAGKQYTVLIPFTVYDDKGKPKRYELGSTYSGDKADDFLADPNPYAPDDGPLIAEKTDDVAVAAVDAAKAQADAAKEN